VTAAWPRARTCCLFSCNTTSSALAASAHELLAGQLFPSKDKRVTNTSLLPHGSMDADGGGAGRRTSMSMAARNHIARSSVCLCSEWEY
jgi:hypothetical protein